MAKKAKKNKSNYANRQWLKSVDKDRDGWTRAPFGDDYRFHMIAPNGKVIKISWLGGKFVINVDCDRIGKPSGYELCCDAMVEAEKLAVHLQAIAQTYLN